LNLQTTVTLCSHKIHSRSLPLRTEFLLHSGVVRKARGVLRQNQSFLDSNMSFKTPKSDSENSWKMLKMAISYPLTNFLKNVAVWKISISFLATERYCSYHVCIIKTNLGFDSKPAESNPSAYPFVLPTKVDTIGFASTLRNAISAKVSPVLFESDTENRKCS